MAGLWHEPDRLTETLRWLNPEAHFSQPFLRLVVPAIDRCFCELGASDFACVVECLREFGQLEECGGLEGLDSLYEARWYPPLWPYYEQFLKDAALRRSGDPKQPPPFFSGGLGSLVKNRVRRFKTAPAYLGRARVGGHEYGIRAWMGEGNQSVELRFDPK